MAAVQTQSLPGKVALVTGGSKGIGAGIVRRLARDGASVAFTYSSSEEKALQLALYLESAGGPSLASALPDAGTHASVPGNLSPLRRVLLSQQPKLH